MLIPTTLKIIIIPVTEKIANLLFKEIERSIDVILESCSFFKDTFPVEVKLKRVGSKVKVIIKDVIKPKVIIQPKSIMGLISLKIKDKKAKMVVKTVYNIGQNILLVVREMISKLSFNGKFFLS